MNELYLSVRVFSLLANCAWTLTDNRYPWWFINLFVRDVIPVILVKPVAIFLPGLKNI